MVSPTPGGGGVAFSFKPASHKKILIGWDVMPQENGKWRQCQEIRQVVEEGALTS
jgi:hypothetical protein